MIQGSTTRRNLALAGVAIAAGLLIIVSSANARDTEIAPAGGTQKSSTAQGSHGGPKKKAVNPATTNCDARPCPGKGN